MGEFEAAADVVTGGVLASTIDPAERVPGADGHSHETHCLNCGTLLVGRHCHACGQHAHVHRTLGAFFHDLVHGILHVDGKLWRTLGLLAWHPGRLTRRYVEGERAKFVSPMALFLFTVFLTFAAISLTAGEVNVGGDQSVSEAIRKEEANLKELKAELAQAKATNGMTFEIEKELGESQKDLELLKDMKAGGISKATIKRASVSSGDGALGQWLAPQIEHIRDNPALFVYKLQSSAYKYSWLLIPISVPFLWLLFPFSRRFRLYDHTVFVTYSLSFMTLALTVMIAAGMLGLGFVAGMIALYLPFHMYRQLKEAYALSTAGAVIRTILLSVFAGTAGILFGLAIAALTI